MSDPNEGLLGATPEARQRTADFLAGLPFRLGAGPSCPEAEGRVLVHPDMRTTHDILLDEGGMCPWCGETE